MLTFNIDIQKLTKQQIIKLKSWLALAIVVVLLGQSVVSYLLIFSLKDENTFSQEVSNTESKVKHLHHETKQKILALLDLDHSSDKQNRGGANSANVAPFNLYCEDLSVKLPYNHQTPSPLSSNFNYLNLYYFNLYLKIPHPPQCNPFTGIFLG